MEYAHQEIEEDYLVEEETSIDNKVDDPIEGDNDFSCDLIINYCDIINNAIQNVCDESAGYEEYQKVHSHDEVFRARQKGERK